MFPVVKIKTNKTSSIYRHHPWIFSGALESIDKNIKNMDLVQISTQEGERLGVGIYFDSSIAVKIIYFGSKVKSAEDIINDNLAQAFAIRELLFRSVKNTDTYRIVNAEGDFMPGLVIDKYGSLAVIQIQSGWLTPYLDIVVEFLKKHFARVYNKSAKYLGGKDSFLYGDEISEIEIHESGLKYIVDFINGQKTGFFIDQRINREFIGQYSKDLDVLNVFSYSGGFSVSAFAGGAKSVTSLDYSQGALDLAQKSFLLNFNKEHDIICADFFKYESDKKYDLVVLDPPAFTKHRSAIKEAVNGYMRVNRKAIRLMKNSGYLATFSCSQLISEEDFIYAVQQAVLAEGKDAKIISRFNQSPCHVNLISHPEGKYLKGLFLYIS